MLLKVESIRKDSANTNEERGGRGGGGGDNNDSDY